MVKKTFPLLTRSFNLGKFREADDARSVELVVNRWGTFVAVMRGASVRDEDAPVTEGPHPMVPVLYRMYDPAGVLVGESRQTTMATPFSVELTPEMIDRGRDPEGFCT